MLDISCGTEIENGEAFGWQGHVWMARACLNPGINNIRRGRSLGVRSSVEQEQPGVRVCEHVMAETVVVVRQCLCLGQTDRQTDTAEGFTICVRNTRVRGHAVNRTACTGGTVCRVRGHAVNCTVCTGGTVCRQVTIECSSWGENSSQPASQPAAVVPSVD